MNGPGYSHLGMGINLNLNLQHLNLQEALLDSPWPNGKRHGWETQ